MYKGNFSNPLFALLHTQLLQEKRILWTRSKFYPFREYPVKEGRQATFARLKADSPEHVSILFNMI